LIRSSFNFRFNNSIADLQAAIVIDWRSRPRFRTIIKQLRNNRQILGTICGCFFVGKTLLWA